MAEQLDVGSDTKEMDVPIQHPEVSQELPKAEEPNAGEVTEKAQPMFAEHPAIPMDVDESQHSDVVAPLESILTQGSQIDASNLIIGDK